MTTPTPTPTPTPGSPTWMRPLGSTGLQVSAVCAGGSPLGSMPKLYGRDVSADEGVATVREVLQSPIRVLDTSNGYSDGASERRIGAAIAASGALPGGFVVATKVDARGRDYSGDRVGASVAESRERLGLDFLPLVHLHDPENFDFDEIAAPGGAVDALVSLKESGEVARLASPAAGSRRWRGTWRSACSTCCWSTTVGRFWTAAREPSSPRLSTAAWESSMPRCTEAASWRVRAAGRPPTATGRRHRRSSRQSTRCAAHASRTALTSRPPPCSSLCAIPGSPRPSSA